MHQCEDLVNHHPPRPKTGINKRTICDAVAGVRQTRVAFDWCPAVSNVIISVCVSSSSRPNQYRRMWISSIKPNPEPATLTTAASVGFKFQPVSWMSLNQYVDAPGRAVPKLLLFFTITKARYSIQTMAYCFLLFQFR